MSRTRPRWLAAATTLAVLCGASAGASPPTRNELGARFALVTHGSAKVIDIRLLPTTAFDTVHVEAGSGAASVAPACVFTSVSAGTAYHCQVTAVHQGGVATLSIKVVGEKAPDPDKPKVFEISHFTVPNEAYVPPPAAKKPRASPNLLLTPPADAAKRQ